MIIFLHGFLGSPEDWSPLLQHLNSPYRCLTLPGHLGIPFDPYFLEKEISEKITLVGYSLGGRLAMQFAHKYPKKIERLILLSANPGLEKEKEKRITEDEKWISLIQEEGIDLFLEQWYGQELFAPFSLSDAIKKRRKMHDPEGLCAVLKHFSPAKLPNLWPHLKKFSFPTLFLFGENDIKYQPIGKRLMEEFNVQWIPGASHPIHMEVPEAVANVINKEIL